MKLNRILSIILILILFLSSCNSNNDKTTIFSTIKTKQEKTEVNTINNDPDFMDYFSISNYYLLDGNLYKTYGKERIINDSSITYLDSIFLNDVILKLEIKTDSTKYKESYGDVFTLEIEYNNVELDLEQAKTSLYQKSNNIVELYYPKVEKEGTITEYIYLTIKIVGNGYIKLNVFDNNIYTIDFTDICDYEYNILDDYNLSITKYIGNDTNVIIPESIGDYTFTKIEANAFSNSTNIKSISIPSTITQIDKDAFNGCSNLIYNSLNSLVYLGNDTNPYLVLVKTKDKTLKEYNIESTTSVILDNEIFKDCSNLEKVTFNNTNINTDDLIFPTERLGYNIDSISKEKEDNKLVYYISWSPINYSITYNLDGGLNSSSNPSTYTIESDNITLLNPTKDGYTFKGWSEGNTITKGSTGNKTFTAIFDLYTLSTSINNTNAGTITNYSNKGITAGDSITLTAIVNIGYKFIGWYNNDTLLSSELSYAFSMPNNSITYTAKYELVKYTISYDLNNGINNSDNPSTYTIEDNITLNNPYRLGYEFKGWSEGNTINKGSTGNKIFTAYYEVINYTITYNLNGGTNNSSNPSIYTIESDDITLSNPIKEGYTFIKWNEGNTITKGSTGNKTFTANFGIITYTITYNLDGGINDASNPSTYTTESNNITLLDPAKEGYTFKGWSEGNTIVEGSIGNKTFTAYYEIINYTISYNLDGGTNNSSNPSTYTIESDNITLLNPTKVGYTFIKWNEGNTITKGSTGNKTFTAVFDLYTLSTSISNTNAGTITNYNNKGITAGDSITLTATVNTGYKFIGWYNNDTLLSSELSYTFSMPNNSISYTAKYELITYSITYNLDGGTNNELNPTSYTIESNDIVLLNPSKKGYTFIKWSEGNTITKGSTGNKIFTASWEIIHYTITYNLNGGINDESNPTTYTVEDEITLKKPKKEGYNYAYWDDGGIIAKGSTGNKTFTASYKNIDLNNIEYGEYPQTLVKDTNLISILDTITATDEQGYIHYNNEKYYKYSGTSYTDNDGNTVSKGYHYYKVEPIKWRSLKTDVDNVLVLAEYILDAHRYDNSSNNYKESEIREWLNSTFLDTAFYYDDSLILTTTVDNSVASTGNSTNQYVCETTYDKVFLLSVSDYVNSNYGFSINSSRYAKTTEFARARGAYYSTSGDYIYNGFYWTRSPYYDYSNHAYNVSYVGYILYNDRVYGSSNGVRPALSLSLSGDN